VGKRNRNAALSRAVCFIGDLLSKSLLAPFQNVASISRWFADGIQQNASAEPLERRVYLSGIPYVVGAEHYTVGESQPYILYLYPNGNSVNEWTINWGDGTPNSPDLQTVSGSASSATHTFTVAPSNPVISANALGTGGTVLAQSSLGLDPRYGTNGRQSTGSDNGAEAFAIQSNGDVVAIYGDGVERFGDRLERFNSNGSLDSAFGTEVGQLPFQGNADSQAAAWTSVTVATNGDIVVGGSYDYSLVMVVFDSTGRELCSGKSSPFGSYASSVFSDVAYAGDEIAVAGGGNGAAGYQADVAVFNASNGDGIWQKEIPTHDNQYVQATPIYTFEKVTIDPGDGNVDATRVIYSGHSGSYYYRGVVDRLELSSSGTVLDDTVYSEYSYSYTTANVAIDPVGRVLLGGHDLERFLPDDSVDTNFGNQGLVAPPFAILQIIAQSNGQTLVLGQYSTGAYVLARYNSNGTLDSTFGQNGILSGLFTGSSESQPEVAQITNGDYEVAAMDGDGNFDITQVYANNPVAAVGAPHVTFGAVNTIGTVGNPVTINSTVTSGGNPTDTLTYDWGAEYGTNTFSFVTSGPNLTFTPNTNGTWSVSLTVTDSSLTPTLTATATNALSVVPQPLSIAGPGTTNEGTAVNYIATGPGSSSATWTEIFVNTSGNTSTYTPAIGVGTYSFTPTEAGNYTIKATSTNAGTSNTSGPINLNVAYVTPTISIVGSPVGFTGQAMSFSSNVAQASGVNDPLDYTWTLVNSAGTVLTTGTDMPSFAIPGLSTSGAYDVLLTVEDHHDGTFTSVQQNLAFNVFSPTQSNQFSWATAPITNSYEEGNPLLSGATAETTEPDGKIVIAGWFSESHGFGVGQTGTVGGFQTNVGVFVARFNADMTLDTSFGPDHTGIEMLPDAPFGPDFQNAFFNSSVTLNGMVPVPLAMTFNPENGDIVMVGGDGMAGNYLLTASGGPQFPWVAELLSAPQIGSAGQLLMPGSLDPNFNYGNFYVLPENPNVHPFGTNAYTVWTGFADAVTVVPTDGSLIIGGFQTFSTDSQVLSGTNYGGGIQDFLLFKLSSSGALDTAFGDDGIAADNWVNGTLALTSLQVPGDYSSPLNGDPYSDVKSVDFDSQNNNIFVGGYASTNPESAGSGLASYFNNTDFVIQDYNSSGQLNTSFGTSGQVFTPASAFTIGSTPGTLAFMGSMEFVGSSSQNSNSYLLAVGLATASGIDVANNSYVEAHNPYNIVLAQYNAANGALVATETSSLTRRGPGQIGYVDPSQGTGPAGATHPPASDSYPVPFNSNPFAPPFDDVGQYAFEPNGAVAATLSDYLALQDNWTLGQLTPSYSTTNGTQTLVGISATSTNTFTSPDADSEASGPTDESLALDIPGPIAVNSNGVFAVGTAALWSGSPSMIDMLTQGYYTTLPLVVRYTMPTATASLVQVNAAVMSTGTVQLTWSGIGAAQGYEIEKSTSTSGGSLVSPETLAFMGRSTTSYTDASGITAGTTYYYQVYAVNMGTSGTLVPGTASAIASATAFSTNLDTLEQTLTVPVSGTAVSSETLTSGSKYLIVVSGTANLAQTYTGATANAAYDLDAAYWYSSTAPAFNGTVLGESSVSGTVVGANVFGLGIVNSSGQIQVPDWGAMNVNNHVYTYAVVGTGSTLSFAFDNADSANLTSGYSSQTLRVQIYNLGSTNTYSGTSAVRMITSPTSSGDGAPPQIAVATPISVLAATPNGAATTWALVLSSSNANYTLAASTSSVGQLPLTGASVATVDPTRYPNGDYLLELTDGQGNLGDSEEIDIESISKLGDLTQSDTDLTLSTPSGVSIPVTRVYDSDQANVSGSVGNGWSLNILNSQLNVTTALDSYNPMNFASEVMQPNDYLSFILPDNGANPLPYSGPLPYYPTNYYTGDVFQFQFTGVNGEDQPSFQATNLLRGTISGGDGSGNGQDWWYPDAADEGVHGASSIGGNIPTASGTLTVIQASTGSPVTLSTEGSQYFYTTSSGNTVQFNPANTADGLALKFTDTGGTSYIINATTGKVESSTNGSSSNNLFGADTNSSLFYYHNGNIVSEGLGSNAQTMRAGNLVSLTVPGDGQHVFEFDPTVADSSLAYSGSPGSVDYNANFIALDGSGASLSVILDPQIALKVPAEEDMGGWSPTYRSLNTQVSLRYDPTDNEFLYVDHEGDLVSFNPANPAFGLAYQLTTASGTIYIINAATGEIESASSGGTIVYMVDPTTGNIVDGNGNTLLNINWTNGQWQGSQISSIDVPGQNPITYSYSGGNLTAVTDGSGNQTLYSYSGHLLTGITGGQGVSVLQAQYDPVTSALTSVTGVNGVNIPIDTGLLAGEAGIRTSTDAAGDIVESVYDDFGNVVRTIQPLTIENSSGIWSLSEYQVSEVQYVYGVTQDGEPSPGAGTVTVLQSINTFAPFEVSGTDSSLLRYTEQPSLSTLTHQITYVTDGEFLGQVESVSTQLDFENPPALQMTVNSDFALVDAEQNEIKPLVVTTEIGQSADPHVQSTVYSQYNNQGDLLDSFTILGPNPNGPGQLLGSGSGSTYSSNGQVLMTFNIIGTVTLSSSGTSIAVSQYGPILTTDTYYPQGKNLSSSGEWTPCPSPPSSTVPNGSAGLLESSTNAAGQETVYAYNAAGQTVLTFTDKIVAGSTLWVGTTNTYDDQGRLTDTYQETYHGDASNDGYLYFQGTGTNGVSVVTSLNSPYNSNSSLRTVHNDYNSAGQLADSINEYGGETTYYYNTNGQTVETVNPDGTETLTVYDSLGRAIWTTNKFVPGTNGLVPVATYTIYNGAGQVAETATYENVGITITPAAGSTTAYASTIGSTGTFVSSTTQTYDQQGRVIDTTSPSGLQTGTVYYPNGQVEYTGPINPSASTLSADLSNGVLTLSDFASYTQNLYDQWDASLGMFYNEVIDQNGHWTKTYTDSLGRTVRTVYEDGSFTETLYSVGSQQVKNDQEQDGGQAYDNILGKSLPQTSLPNPDVVNGESYLGIPSGGSEAVSIAQRMPGDLAVLTYDFYDNSGNLVGVYEPLVMDSDPTSPSYGQMINPYTQYIYDAAGNETEEIDAKGNITTFTYDQNGNELSRTLPDGETETFTYDQFGRESSHTNFDGQLSSYSYYTLPGSGSTAGTLSELGMLSQIYYWASETAVTYTYDNMGRQSSVIDASGTNTYSYDIFGNQTQAVTPEGTINYVYDPVTGNHTETYTSNTQTNYGYDNQGRLTSVTSAKLNGGTLTSANTNTYGYDLAGNKTSETLANGVVNTYTYDDENRLIKDVQTNSSGTILFTQQYTLTPDGTRATSLESQVQPNGSTQLTFSSWTYDAEDRLTGEYVTDLPTQITLPATYDVPNNAASVTMNWDGTGAFVSSGVSFSAVIAGTQAGFALLSPVKAQPIDGSAQDWLLCYSDGTAGQQTWYTFSLDNGTFAPDTLAVNGTYLPMVVALPTSYDAFSGSAAVAQTNGQILLAFDGVGAYVSSGASVGSILSGTQSGLALLSPNEANNLSLGLYSDWLLCESGGPGAPIYMLYLSLSGTTFTPDSSQAPSNGATQLPRLIEIPAGYSPLWQATGSNAAVNGGIILYWDSGSSAYDAGDDGGVFNGSGGLNGPQSAGVALLSPQAPNYNGNGTDWLVYNNSGSNNGAAGAMAETSVSLSGTSFSPDGAISTKTVLLPIAYDAFAGFSGAPTQVNGQVPLTWDGTGAFVSSSTVSGILSGSVGIALLSPADASAHGFTTGSDWLLFDSGGSSAGHYTMLMALSNGTLQPDGGVNSSATEYLPPTIEVPNAYYDGQSGNITLNWDGTGAYVASGTTAAAILSGSQGGVALLAPSEAAANGASGGDWLVVYSNNSNGVSTLAEISVSTSGTYLSPDGVYSSGNQVFNTTPGFSYFTPSGSVAGMFTAPTTFTIGFSQTPTFSTGISSTATFTALSSTFTLSYANTYSYDLNSNRMSDVHVGPGGGASSTTTYSYNGDDQLIGQITTTPGTTQFSDTASTYDANGSMTAQYAGAPASDNSFGTFSTISANSSVGTTTASVLSTGSTGLVTTALGSSNTDASAETILPNGDILVVGNANDTNIGHQDIALIAYNPTTGAPDNSFGSSGVVLTDVGTPAVANAVVVSGSNIYVAGYANDSNGHQDIMVAKYNLTGTLVSTFGTNGFELTNMTGSSSQANAIAMSGSNILVAGFGPLSSTNNQQAILIAEYNSGGTLVSSFGNSGITTTAVGTNSAVANAMLFNGTSIFVAGNGAGGSAVLAVYNTAGLLTHLTATNINGSASWNAIGLSSSGSNVLVAGTASNGDSSSVIALGEYNTSGTLVSSFGTSGITLTPVGGAVYNNAGGMSAGANAMVIESGGKILLSGHGQYYASAGVKVEGLVLAQYTSSGALDPTFGTDGVVTPPTGMFSGVGDAMSVLSNGNLVVAGQVKPAYGSASMFVAEYDLTPQTSTYTYNAQNKLVTYALNGTTQATYLYDDDGDRVEETVNGTATYYLIDTNNPTGYDQPIEQKASPTATPSETYVIGDRVLGQADGSGTPTWLLVDGHGSTRLLTNASGTVTATLNYDASGNALNFNPATIGTIWQFGGDGYYDYASSLTFHSNGRQSSSIISRFITEDDQVYMVKLDPVTGNLYILDDGDPENGSDPSGHDDNELEDEAFDEADEDIAEDIGGYEAVDSALTSGVAQADGSENEAFNEISAEMSVYQGYAQSWQVGAQSVLFGAAGVLLGGAGEAFAAADEGTGGTGLTNVLEDFAEDEAEDASSLNFNLNNASDDLGILDNTGRFHGNLPTTPADLAGLSEEEVEDVAEQLQESISQRNYENGLSPGTSNLGHGDRIQAEIGSLQFVLGYLEDNF
jgi:uncharacterized delta-60 repeat protein